MFAKTELKDYDISAEESLKQQYAKVDTEKAVSYTHLTLPTSSYV